MPIYYIINDEETREKVYDFEEMADELENRIHKALNRNVLITISEVEEEKWKNITLILEENQWGLKPNH